MAVKKEVMRSGWLEAAGILMIALGVLSLLGLFSYDWKDIGWLSSPPNDPPGNFIGPFGAILSYGIFFVFGAPGYLFPIALIYAGLFSMLRPEGGIGRRLAWSTLFILAVGICYELNTGASSSVAALNVPFAGGILSHLLATKLLVGLIGAIGTGIVATALLVISIIMIIEIHPAVLWEKIKFQSSILSERIAEWRRGRMDRKQLIEEEQKKVADLRRKLEKSMQAPAATKPSRATTRREAEAEKPVAKVEEKPRGEAGPPDEEPETEVLEEEDTFIPPPPPPTPPPRPKPVVVEKKKVEKPAAAEVPFVPPALPENLTGYQLPPLSLLDATKHDASAPVNTEGLQDSGVVLKETLAEFGIDVEVTNVERGPVVTRYELLPAPGVKLEKITGLSNNIALAMKAESIRVQAPIPGKGVVGIEIPNSVTTTVYFRELVESAYWQSGKAALPLALGKDVGGHVLIADLADMPHMLIAGATGAGKTVCMNSILTGLLMARSPDQMKLMLVDPKIVEFSAYNTLPHLIVPVITDPKKVSHGLRWAISEMERRYKLFAKAGVRNIKGYNNRPIVKQEELFATDPANPAVPPPPPEDKIPDRVPYIVIVIDELADLMLAAQAEIENYIARLAQLSRATGIHMIIATQRPSVNVITGTIKANFPARISFQVAQKVDSRTILDGPGADKLLGKGDMLFLQPGSGKLVRAQGTYTSDGEIHRVVDFIKAQGHKPVFEQEIQKKIENTAPDLPEMDDSDDLIEAAVEIIRQTKRASTSSLQRRLRIGYTRAARIMDILEQKGVVGPAQGADPREILIDLDGEVPTHPDQQQNPPPDEP